MISKLLIARFIFQTEKLVNVLLATLMKRDQQLTSHINPLKTNLSANSAIKISASITMVMDKTVTVQSASLVGNK